MSDTPRTKAAIDAPMDGPHGLEIAKRLMNLCVELERECAVLKANLENAVWNLAGCDTIASGHGKPFDYAKDLARPALDAVSKLRAERDELAAWKELLADRARLDWLEKHGATPICSRAAIDAARYRT